LGDWGHKFVSSLPIAYVIARRIVNFHVKKNICCAVAISNLRTSAQWKDCHAAIKINYAI